MANITEQTGDIFSAPANSILIHACNAKGVWGSGVALAFKKKFPIAFKVYVDHCNPQFVESANLAQHQSSLAGTALLIPPSTPREKHWVACLFTSVGYGRNVDPIERIVTNTERAVADLAKQIDEVRSKERDGTAAVDSPAVSPRRAAKAIDEKLIMGPCWSVRLNSGRFGVDWLRTKTVLECGTLDIHVVHPPSEDGHQADGTN
ncbi:ADP-ribose 1''-phosphate phosphatase [Pseudocyphellaria aurata]|nr:ADP-ribose 1''-phosphate phosphatase [Pseudocyphellaria aurata]